jgi:hypothetical protein
MWWRERVERRNKALFSFQVYFCSTSPSIWALNFCPKGQI